MATLSFLPLMGLSNLLDAVYGRMLASAAASGERSLGLSLSPPVFLRKSRPEVRWLVSR